MNQFQFSTANARRSAKNKLFKLIPMFTICGIVGISISFITNEIKFDIIVLIVSIIGVFMAALLGFKNAINVDTEKLLKTTYILDDLYIEKRTSKRSLKIEFNNVSVCKKCNDGLLIKAKRNQIFIPEQLDNFEKLIEQLAHKVEIEI